MKVMVSECCNALPLFNRIEGRQGVCAKCNEHSEFYLDFWQEERVAVKSIVNKRKDGDRRKGQRRTGKEKE